MRIDKGQKIVGHPALKIRRIIREAARHHLTPQRAQEILCCSDSSARKVIRDLEAEGFMESVKGRLEVSIKGNALAMARTAAPLSVLARFRTKVVISAAVRMGLLRLENICAPIYKQMP